MPDPSAGNVTRLLLAWRAGNESALNRPILPVYCHIRHLTHCPLQEEDPGQTRGTIALANEARPRIVDARQVAWRDRARFCALSAQTTRRILVDVARAKGVLNMTRLPLRALKRSSIPELE